MTFAFGTRGWQVANVKSAPLALIFLGVLLLAGLVCRPAFAEKRVALVIGNSAYRSVPRLANPANDSAAMAEVFRNAKFDVVEARNNLSVVEMRRALRDFAIQAQDADVAVVYYAGHGIEVDGTNYLIPTDAQLETDTDVYDEALPLERVLVAVDGARQLRLIILDACRDNPFSKAMKRTVASRSVGRGLAKVEPTNPNTMIAFAAKAGSTASDGEKNSPFAVALTNHLTTPGLDLRKAFGFVRDDVLKATGNRQEPFIYGSLGGNDVALVPAPSAAAPPAAAGLPAPAADPNAPLRRDYEMAAQVGTKEAWDLFIATYPDGFYAKLAIAQRNKLLAEEARVAAAEQARVADTQARQAAEDAKAAERMRAEAQAEETEQARIAAEKKKAANEAERAPSAASTKADEDTKAATARAKAEEEARAAQSAKAAEQARIAADKQKAIEESKLVEAERARAAAQARAAEEEARLAEAKASAEALQQAKAAEDARLAREAGQARQAAQNDKLAALTPPGQQEQAAPGSGDVATQLQSELRRVGCNTGAVDGNWNEAARKSLALFNRHAGTTLDVKLASLDALDVVRSKKARICPLVCDRGFKADGDTCVKISCKPGYRAGDDGACAKIDDKKPAEPKAQTAAPAKQQAQTSGQVYCNNQGCYPVHKGCFIGHAKGTGTGGVQREICP